MENPDEMDEMDEETPKEIRLTPEMIEELQNQKKEEKKPELQLTPDLVEALIKSKESGGGGEREEGKLEDVFGTEEATAKCLIELIKAERINLLTDLTFEEIQALVVAEAFGQFLWEKLKSDLLLNICALYKELKVSLGRRGRTEICDLATFVSGIAEEKKGRLPSLLPQIR
jgi:hypothetical protein